MAKARAVPNILYPDFPRFVGLFGGDPGFPYVYHAWASAYAAQVAGATGESDTIIEQVVRPIEFLEWCYANNRAIRFSSLQAFAEFKAT